MKFITIDDLIVTYYQDNIEVIQYPQITIHNSFARLSGIYDLINKIEGKLLLELNQKFLDVLTNIMPPNLAVFKLAVIEGDTSNRSSWNELQRYNNCQVELFDKQDYFRWMYDNLEIVKPLDELPTKQMVIPIIFDSFLLSTNK